LVVLREHGTVNLPERGGSERLGVDPAERRFERNAKLTLGEGANGIERHRGHFVLQADELVRNHRGKHIQAGRHELTQLDHEATEVNRESVEPARNQREPACSGASRYGAQTDAREDKFKPPCRDQLTRGKANDASIARARSARCQGLAGDA
jgi:hypothetical protein